MDDHRENSDIPAEPNSVLNEGDPEDPLTEAEQADYHKGTRARDLERRAQTLQASERGSR